MGRVVAAAVYSAGKKVSDITLDEGAAWAAKPGHFVWIGLEEPSAQELNNLQRQFNLHELAIEDAMEKHSRPKLETFGDALFIVTYSPVRENGKLEFIETHILPATATSSPPATVTRHPTVLCASVVRRARCCWSMGKISYSMRCWILSLKTTSR